MVPCHPGHNAVSSISGCPSCDHAVLSFHHRVTLSTLLCYSLPTGKATPVRLVAGDMFPSSATMQRNENKSECSLRSRREITDVLVPDCNMAAWSLLALSLFPSLQGKRDKGKAFLFLFPSVETDCFLENRRKMSSSVKAGIRKELMMTHV